MVPGETHHILLHLQGGSYWQWRPFTFSLLSFPSRAALKTTFLNSMLAFRQLSESQEDLWGEEEGGGGRTEGGSLHMISTADRTAFV
jgi:hypothetical protein